MLIIFNQSAKLGKRLMGIGIERWMDVLVGECTHGWME